MNLHHGQIVEKVIRRNGYSISELARLANVNRRSVYNWFNQPYLKPSIIHRIGAVLRYDFSEEFPELYANNEVLNSQLQRIADVYSNDQVRPAEQYFWKDKYIELLERYNKLLINCVESGGQDLKNFHTPSLHNSALTNEAVL